MCIADIAILAIIDKSIKPIHNSETIQRTETADPLLESLPQNMNSGILIKLVTLKISDPITHDRKGVVVTICIDGGTVGARGA